MKEGQAATGRTNTLLVKTIAQRRKNDLILDPTSNRLLKSFCKPRAASTTCPASTLQYCQSLPHEQASRRRASASFFLFHMGYSKHRQVSTGLVFHVMAHVVNGMIIIQASFHSIALPTTLSVFLPANYAHPVFSAQLKLGLLCLYTSAKQLHLSDIAVHAYLTLNAQHTHSAVPAAAVTATNLTKNLQRPEIRRRPHVRVCGDENRPVAAHLFLSYC